MSSEHEPVRWADPDSDCDPALRRLLGSARAGLGDAALGARIAHAVDAQLAALSGAPATARSWRPWVGLAALLLGLGGVTLWQRAAPPVTTAAAPRAAAVSDEPATRMVDTPAAERGESSTASRATDRTQPRVVTIASADTAQPVGTRATRERATTRAAQARATPTSQRQRPKQRVATSTPQTSSAPGAPEQTATRPELELISEAQRALRTDPAHALALSEQHARSYPHGRFNEDREEIAISALWALGQHAEGRTRAEAFLARHPRSLAAPRVARLLDGR
jgi:hypothetical protein